MLKFNGKIPQRDNVFFGVFADNKTKTIRFEFNRFVEEHDLSTFNCGLHIEKLGYIEMPITISGDLLHTKMVVSNGITNYPGVHCASFKFTKGDLVWATHNFFIKVFERHDLEDDVKEEPP